MIWQYKSLQTKLITLIHHTEICHKEHDLQRESDFPFKSKLILLEAEKSLQECRSMLLPDSSTKTLRDLQDQLEYLLKKRWERIKGSCLSYTTLSNRDQEGYIQNFYIQIARILNEISSNKSVYAYLMPSLIGEIAEVLPLKKDNIQHYALEECISDDFDHYLLPVSEILYQYYYSSSTLYHPFTGRILSSKEEARLWQHSNTTEFLRNLLNQLEREEIQHFSLGKCLNELIQALREGGESKNPGNCCEAKTPALVGVLNFKLIWDTFSEEDRLYAMQCTDNFDHTLQQVISILFKEDKTTFDCIEYLSYTIEIIVKRHPKLYWIGNTPENIETLTRLRNSIEAVYHAIDTRPYGTDKHLPLTPSLYHTFRESILIHASALITPSSPSYVSLEVLYQVEMTLTHHLQTLKNRQISAKTFLNFLNPLYLFQYGCFRVNSLLSTEISITQKLLDALKGITPKFTHKETKTLLELCHLRRILSKYVDLVPEFKDLLHINSPFKLEVLSPEALITQL